MRFRMLSTLLLSLIVPAGSASADMRFNFEKCYKLTIRPYAWNPAHRFGGMLGAATMHSGSGQHMAGDAEQAGGIAQDAAGSAKARVLGGSAVQVGLRQLDEIL